MATLIVNTDTGVDYASQSLAEAAMPATLTEAYIVECSGSTIDSGRADYGAITSVTNTITVIGVGSSRFNGVFGEGYVFNRGWNGYNILTRHGYFTLDGIEISGVGYTDPEVAIYASGVDSVKMLNCGVQYLYNILRPGNSDEVENCLILNCLHYSISNVTARNCTVYVDIGYGAYSGDIIIRDSGCTNVLLVNLNTKITYSSFHDCTGDYNIAAGNNASVAPGSNSITNAVAADLFTAPTDTPPDLTLKTGSNAIGAGTDLSAYFTTDITGATRTVPWDIGAFAYIAASTVPTLSAPSFVGRIPSTTLAF
ncbi:MAG: hypothetical protein PF440_09750 [Thiomicrorhabdus sp.]|jgi:hypothetical protein|nr:hypothetical protein [Thiomicrorhabdus sp.]